MFIREGDFEFRYRVIRVWNAGELGDQPFAYGDECREFKTLAGAKAYQDRLVNEGYPAVLQVGIVRWMSHEQAEVEYTRLMGTAAREVMRSGSIVEP